MKTKNHILLDLPDHIETARLTLRIPRAGDGMTVYPAVMQSANEIAPFLDFPMIWQSDKDTERFLRDALAKFILRTDYIFLLFRREDEAFVGLCGAHLRNDALPEYELGYWLVTPMSRQGYVTEAAQAVVDYVFSHLAAERLMIRCDKRNQASANIARRLGFVEEGCMRAKEVIMNDGGVRDMLFFSQLRGEWAG